MAEQLPGGANIPNPALPQFNFSLPTNMQGSTQFTNANVDFGNIAKLLTAPPQSMVNSALPAMQSQFAATGANLAPALSAIRETTAGNVAGAQSDAMRRGLTGSDIEAAGMGGARAAGAAQEAQLVGQAGLQEAQTMAQAIMQAFGHDIDANASMYQNLAQLIGQKMSSDQNYKMFKDQLDQALRISHATGNNQLLASLISAGGQVVGAKMSGGGAGGGGAAAAAA